MQRPRAWRRHKNWCAIKRKERILDELMPNYGSENWTNDGKEMNRLNKGKIFCSCPMCSMKTKYMGSSLSDYRQFEKLQSSLEEEGFDLKILPVKGWW